MLLDGTPTELEPYVASIKSLFFTTCCFNAASCPSGRLLLINLKKIKDMTREQFIGTTGSTSTEDQFKAEPIATQGTEEELAAAKETNRELGNRIADLGDIIDSKDVEIGRLKDCIRLLEAQKTAHEVKEERMKERYADRTDEFFRYRKALIIARLMLENLHEEADGEDLTMVLDEIGAALAAGTGSKA